MSEKQTGARLLVIEDNTWIRMLLVDVLTAHGYRVVEASNGHTGLMMAERLRPELVLLDLALPELSGVEVLRSLKGHQQVWDPRVIVISAHPEMLSATDANLLDGLLGKPFECDVLMSQVSRLVTPDSGLVERHSTASPC